MKSKLSTCLLLTATIFVAATSMHAQKRDVEKPPPETATLVESQKWFVDSFAKYASYKTRVQTVTISNAKFDGCTFTFTQTRKAGSVSTATMGATRTVNTVKDDVSLNLSTLLPDGIKVSDHVFPELQTLELKFAGDERIVEIVVKGEASEAFKSALLQIRRLCIAKD
jgi:hypothetical protein